MPVARLKDRVKEYMHEQVAGVGGIELAKRECMDKEWWRLFCHGHPLVGRSQKE